MWGLRPGDSERKGSVIEAEVASEKEGKKTPELGQKKYTGVICCHCGSRQGNKVLGLKSILQANNFIRTSQKCSALLQERLSSIFFLISCSITSTIYSRTLGSPLQSGAHLYVAHLFAAKQHFPPRQP